MSNKSKVLGATGGAVGLSAVALAFGLCCVAPWAVALLGVGGAILLARLAFFQPYVIAGTLVLIGAGFWYAYRKRTGAGGEACAVENRKSLRWMVWVGALIVLALDIASFIPRYW
ncbi:MAG TPA: mercuric transporter MerT family protein [Steroidobacteraceae bacterium]|nr:mercuric transporter MerT family protein [Steroidobacteraceae bacterium]